MGDRMTRLSQFLLALLLAAVTPSGAQVTQIFDSTRIGNVDSHCARVIDGQDYLLTSDRIRQDKAIQACNDAQLRHPEGVFDVVTKTRIRVSVNWDALAQTYPGVVELPSAQLPVLGTPVVVGATRIDIPLSKPWGSLNTPITYSLECSTTSESTGFSEVASGTDIFDGETGYSYTGLTELTQYWCRTEATDSTEATALSNVVTATTEEEPDVEPEEPGDPSNLAIATATTTTLEGWTWTEGENSTHTRILVGLGDGNSNPAGGPLVFDQNIAGESLAEVTGLTPGQEYYGRGCSVNQGVQGGCTPRVYKTTLADPGSNSPPVWNSTPTPSKTEGVGGSYNLLTHVADPNGDTLTCELNSESEDLPTGVTLNSNCSFSDNGTGADGTTTGILVDADDGTNDPVTSPSFSYTILAVGEADIVVDDSGGFDFTTIGAAMAAATCGQVIEVRSGTYNEAIRTRRNCPADNKIVVREQAGQNVIGSGWENRNGLQAFVHFEHTGWECCEGFTFQGSSNPQSGVDITGTPSRGVVIGADDVFVRGNYRNISSVTMTFSGNPQRTRIQADMRTNGNATQANGEDSGDHYRFFSGSDLAVENSFMAEGGHGSGAFERPNVLFYQNLYRGDWGKYVYSPAIANRGSRAFTLRDNVNSALRRLVMREHRKSSDSPRTSMSKFDSLNVSASQIFGTDSTAGGSCIFNGFAKSSGYGNNYIDHVTCHKIDGGGIVADDQSSAAKAGANGPVYVKNVILNDIAQNPGTVTENSAIMLGYWSTKRFWTNEIFVDGLVADSNYPVRIYDRDGVNANIVSTLTAMQSNFPANFKNITICDPDFVSTEISTSIVPATAWDETVASFAPQADCAVGTGQPLTLVNGAVNNSATVTVDDDRWFRDDMGWDEVWDGDQITLCGETVNVINNDTLGDGTIVVSSPVTCANNAPIYRGADSTPNMGAAL